MARGINKVIIVGNCGQDPETRYLPSGGAVTNMSLATSEAWKDKNTGEQQERTEWHKVVFFNRLGEIAGEYLKKGSKVYVEGSLRTRKWQGQDGSDRYTTEIVASEMQMLDSRGGQEGGGGGGGYQQNRPQQNQGQQNQAPACKIKVSKTRASSNSKIRLPSSKPLRAWTALTTISRSRVCLLRTKALFNPF